MHNGGKIKVYTYTQRRKDKDQGLPATYPQFYVMAEG